MRTKVEIYTTDGKVHCVIEEYGKGDQVEELKLRLDHQRSIERLGDITLVGEGGKTYINARNVAAIKFKALPSE